MKKNEVVLESNTYEDVAKSLFFDKDNNFKVNAFVSFVGVLVGGFCLLALKLSERTKEDDRRSE